MKGLRAIWAGILDGYNELFPIVGMNLLWLLFNVPLGFLGLVVIQIITIAMGIEDDSRQSVALAFSLVYAVLLVIGPNPAASGIHLWANRLVKEERVEFALFWEGLRAYLGRSLSLFLIAAVGLFLLIANALFYLRSDLTALRIFGIVWLYAIVLWLTMQLYTLPLLIEQDDKRLRLVLRNAFFLTMANIVPSLVLLIVLSVLILLSVGLTLLIALLTGSVVALIEARALQLLLERNRPTGPTEEQTPPTAA
jgi:uncharacterized membrane protein YesL